MVQRIKPTDVRIITKDGELEISITLDVNINLNTGTLGISVSPETKELPKPNDTTWEIPDFTSERIKFGKGT